MKFAENVATIESNAVFEETVKMSVQNESIAHIIKSLTDMYSNPVLAMSREYVSNAYDATVARMGANSSFGTVLDSPIEVTLPSSLNPNFIIRDYGTGMDKNVLANVFPQYGASTKRGNNVEIGGFGLGAKSALAVVSNFTVVSVKDGKKNIGIVQKGADGVGEVSFLPEQTTDEPSGTTVTITLPNPHALNNVFRDSNLLLGFPHGSILLNGKMHENSVFNTERFTKVGEDGWVINSLLNWEVKPNRWQNTHTEMVGSRWELQVVVGPISYKVSESDLRDEDDPYHASGIFGAATAYSVLNLPIGSVDFTPARENLIYSARTRKTIIEAATRLNDGIHELIQGTISKAETKREAAYRAALYRRAGFDTLDFTYKGETIPTTVTASVVVEGKKVWTANRSNKVTPSLSAYKGDDTRTAVIVTGVENAEDAKFLNRLRKPFADRYDRTNVDTDNLTILYTEAEKSDLNGWASSLVMEIYSKEEWETVGTAYRKEINEERKAKRLANAKTGNAINYGSIPVSVIRTHHNDFERPKVHGSYAGDAGKADTVIYVQLDKSATDTTAHQFAQSLSPAKDGETQMDRRSMNRLIRGLKYHFRDDEKSVSIVRIPANTKTETFIKAVPHAISMDEALTRMAKEMAADKGATLAYLFAKNSNKFAWLAPLTDTVREGIQNEDVRKFIGEAHDTFNELNSRRHDFAYGAKSKVIFSKEFEGLFADFRKEIEASNKFPLPLLEDMAGMSNYAGNLKMNTENAVQYINLMYPAPVAA